MPVGRGYPRAVALKESRCCGSRGRSPHRRQPHRLLGPDRQAAAVELVEAVVRQQIQEQSDEDDSKDGREVNAAEAQWKVFKRCEQVARGGMDEFPDGAVAQINIGDDEVNDEKRQQEKFQAEVKDETQYAALCEKDGVGADVSCHANVNQHWVK